MDLAAQVAALAEKTRELEEAFKQQTASQSTLANGPHAPRMFVWMGKIAIFSKEQWLAVNLVWNANKRRADDCDIAELVFLDSTRHGRELDNLAYRINKAFRAAGMGWRLSRDGCEFVLL